MNRQSVADFGAIGDGETLNTSAIQMTIDAMENEAAAPWLSRRGVFVSGAIFMKPGVNLRLESGAVLRCSSNPFDFPRRRTRVEGHFEEFNVALINAEGCDGLKISGEGMLDGAGEPIWDRFWRGLSHDPDFRNLDLDRARLCFIENCEDVVIDGILLRIPSFGTCTCIIAER